VFKKFNFKIIIFLLVIIFLNVQNVYAKDKNIVNIYFFHSNTCSHCQSEKKLLDTLLEEYDNIKLYSYEIHEETNEDLMKEVGNLYGIEVTGVPVTVIGDTIYTGYSDEEGPSTFIKTIEYYSRYGYLDKTGNYLGIETDNLYSVNEDDISLKEFSDKYKNYKLLFNIYSDDISVNNVSLLIGLLLGINPFVLIPLFLIIFKYRKDNLNCIKVGGIYILSSIIIYSIYNLININCLKIIIPIVLLILSVIFRNKDKIKDYTLVVFIVSIVGILSDFIYPDYLNIYRNIISLNNLSINYRFISYGEVYFVYFFIPLIVFMLGVCLVQRKEVNH
jgi:glutaredoxin